MSRSPLLLAAFAALLGAAGVALAAAAAHEGGGDLLRTASLFLMLHAGASLGVAAHARQNPARRTILAAGFLMEFGAALFSTGLAVRAFAGARLFAFAAPIGGSAAIAAWIALAAAFGTAWAASPKSEAPARPAP